MICPLALATRLIRCPSVTPEDKGALDVLQEALKSLGFQSVRLPFEEEGESRIDNLYAWIGSKVTPHFCFAGHTDVVPIGDLSLWHHDPFGGIIEDGKLWGRGAADMKGAIASFVAAMDKYLRKNGIPRGTISLLITGDEEASAVNGTAKILKYLETQNIVIDDCLVGEPTSAEHLGDMIKIGRRGSLNAMITVTGKQGHVAYPDLAINPVSTLIAMMNVLNNLTLDEGTQYFSPSHLEIVSFDVGNKTTNVIPAVAKVRFNIRYNDHWNFEKLSHWVCEIVNQHNPQKAHVEFNFQKSGDCFLTSKAKITKLVQDVIKQHTGYMTQLSTSGGTSDARFIKDYTRVVECGLVNKTIHQVNEHVLTKDVTLLTDIYADILCHYFSQ